MPLRAQTAGVSPEGGELSPGEDAPITDESAILLGEADAAPAAGTGPSAFAAIRMILVLALAALAIYGAVFFIKRLARPRESADPHLKVLARVPLGADSFAAVISLGAKAWLVGGGSGGLNLISEVEDAETLETMLLADARRSAEAGSRFIDFRSIFRRLGAPRENPEAGGSPGSAHAENLRRQRERLKGQ